jgi:hypothetical protein
MSDFNRFEPGFDVVHRVCAGLYTFTTQFLFDGQHPTHNRSVIAHVPAASAGERGTLVIINPARLEPRVVEQIRQLETELSATVRYLISPGDWHYLFIGQHLAAFPSAKAHVAPGRIPSKQPDFPYTLVDVTAEHPFPELSPHVLALTVDGLRDFSRPDVVLPRYELVFFFPEARAITSGDVLYYHGAAELSERQQTLGQRPRTVDFHFMKWKMVQDPAALKRSLQRVTAWDFDRFLAIHGAPGNLLEAGAKRQIEAVLAWVETGECQRLDAALPEHSTFAGGGSDERKTTSIERSNEECSSTSSAWACCSVLSAGAGSVDRIGS